MKVAKGFLRSVTWTHQKYVYRVTGFSEHIFLIICTSVTFSKRQAHIRKSHSEYILVNIFLKEHNEEVNPDDDRIGLPSAIAAVKRNCQSIDLSL